MQILKALYPEGKAIQNNLLFESNAKVSPLQAWGVQLKGQLSIVAADKAKMFLLKPCKTQRRSRERAQFFINQL